MQLTGERWLPLPRERVWEALQDPRTLQAAIPGCEAVTAEGQGMQTVSVMAAVGPVRARFKGRLQQRDAQPPQRYTLSFEGDGGVAGFARGSADVELMEAQADGVDGTRLVYRAQAQIGGRLAQIGSRLVDAAAARMSAQFFERLTQVLQAPPVPVAEAASAVSAPMATPAAQGVVTAPLVARGVGNAPQAAQGRGLSAPVVVQMPAWAWVVTMVVAATLLAWLVGR